ncbi:MAG: hypothetical protein ACREK6_20895, partial [Candidatus Rokuibacteriota bacterium]
SLDEMLYLLRAFVQADTLMRESPHPRVELEVAAVCATRRPVPQAIDDVLRRLDEAQARLAQYGPGPSAAAPVQENLLADRPAPLPRTPQPAPREAAPRPASAAPAPPPAGEDLATVWQRVVDEVMRKKPVLGAVLAQATPLSVAGGELTIAVAGNHFHRELLADRANRELVLAGVRRWLRDVERLRVSESTGAGPDVAAHPAVQAALAEFEGEVVAVRPRPSEGEGQ